MPKIVDHDARRIEILEGCFSLFARHGYAKLSMRQLASSLGVTTGTIYHYFSSKQQIFEESFSLLQQRDIQLVTSQFSSKTSQIERLQILREFVAVHVERLADVLKISLEYQRVHDSDGNAPTVKRYIEGYKKALQEHVKLPDVLNEAMLSLIFGVLVQYTFNPDFDVKTQLGLGFNVIQPLLLTE